MPTYNINITSQILIFANLAAFPVTGAAKTFYVADDTEKLYRWTGAAYVEVSAGSASTSWGDIIGTLSNQTDLQNALNAKEDESNKGIANGYASLDVSGKVPISQIPDSIVGQVEYQTTWNATTDTPTLPAATGVKGHYYIVSVAGTYNTIDFNVGDWVISNGVEWQKVDNTDAVSSVAGLIGVISAASLKSALDLIGTNSGDNATNTTSNAYADAKVADAINDGITTIAPSQNAVFDALSLKANASDVADFDFVLINSFKSLYNY